ncbi:polynucleotide 5'-hydroxyl-kinase NOL9 [Lutzomyia longipalpis]|uniref:polynucleotide 5'-hydroxyl-kinase NOL9 n=1 Tax=Lutzomyia longipalpis TaxID=7200 RepID=UPI0024842E6A|nr:polynucleotide 5'-hydroxyl-kinase NOL9 [Lutzomyia longipalpis]
MGKDRKKYYGDRELYKHPYARYQAATGNDAYAPYAGPSYTVNSMDTPWGNPYYYSSGPFYTSQYSLDCYGTYWTRNLTSGTSYPAENMVPKTRCPENVIVISPEVPQDSSPHDVLEESPSSESNSASILSDISARSSPIDSGNPSSISSDCSSAESSELLKVSAEIAGLKPKVTKTDPQEIIHSISATHTVHPLDRLNISIVSISSDTDSDEVKNTLRSAKLFAKDTKEKARKKIERNKFYTSIDSSQVLLLLTESIYFYGNLSIKLLAGSASVSGYTLDVEETVKAHVPIRHSSISITPRTSTKDAKCPRKVWKKSLKKNKFIKEMFFDDDLKEIKKNLKDYHAILLIQRTSSRRTEIVEKYSDSRIFPSIVSSRTHTAFAAAEHILQSRFNEDNSPRSDNIRKDPHWDDVIVRKSSRIVVAGGKNVGKSTLIHHLVNENVKKFGKILLIDLDIEQPETFVPQTVSATLLDGPIIGMGCFAEKLPLKSYLFGDQNVANCPQTYIECVAMLLRDVQESQQCKKIPWIVNTIGYVSGIGMELMIALLRLISPTDVIEIIRENFKENFDYKISPKLVKHWTWTILNSSDLPEIPSWNFETYQFNSMNANSPLRPPFDANPSLPATREISILAHLADILEDNCDLFTKSKSVWAPLDVIKFINYTDEHIGEEYTHDIFNANLVYLCRMIGDDIHECLGIGIVRAIDKVSRTLYLLPSTRENLVEVNALALCGTTIPFQLMILQQSGIRGHLPYVYTTREN